MRFALRPPALCLVWFCLFAAAIPSARAQATIQALINNGPVSNRLNIVFLSEAYTTNELETNQFLTDATNALNHLFAYEPYQEYQAYCNAYAISVASIQSGSTHPENGVSNNTYFHSSYDAVYDYIITIPPNALDANANDGQNKVNSLIESLMPQCGLPVILVNDLKDGGSGGSNCISAAESGESQYIIVHESGHTLGKLGDEYVTDYSGLGPDYVDFSNAEEPNTTTNSNPATIKWGVWIPTNTPIPTPETFEGPPFNSFECSTNVGLFQGAHYNSNGWYRAKCTCLMQTIAPGTPFCEICTETLVKAIYQKARPIDAISPASNTVSISTSQAVAFSVTPLQPLTHSLAVQWFTNGVAIPDATNAAFSFVPANFTNGSYALMAQVHDPTPMVRTDPGNLLTETASWTVKVNNQTLVHPAFFDGEAALNNGVYFLVFPDSDLFGYYTYAFFPYLYHFDLGFEYFFDANDGQGDVYFYDFTSSHFWYTGPKLFPYVYDFGLNSWLYYFPNPQTDDHYTTNPRSFYNFETGKIITQ